MREWAGELCAGAGDVGLWASSPRPADLRRYNVYPLATSAGSARRCAGLRFTLHSPTAGRACSIADPPGHQQTRAKEVSGRTPLYESPQKTSSPRTAARKMMFFVLEEKVRRLKKPHRPMSCILSVCSALATLLCTLLPRCCACS